MSLTSDLKDKSIRISRCDGSMMCQSKFVPLAIVSPHLVGQRVRVRRDEAGIGALIYVM
jgi:hypothetical protein